MDPRIPDVLVPLRAGLEHRPDGLAEHGAHHVHAGLVNGQLALVNSAEVLEVLLILVAVIQMASHIFHDLKQGQIINPINPSKIIE